MGRCGDNIRQRADGRWEARVVQGLPVGRRTNYKYLYGSSYEEVSKKKTIFLLTHSAEEEGSRSGLPEAILLKTEADGPTVREAALEWLKNKKASVKESTFAYYTVMVNNHVIPGLGTASMNELTSERIADFLTERKNSGRIKDGKPLANKTVSDLKMIVKQILSFAQARRMVKMAPSCPSVPARQPPISVLSKVEQEKLETIVRKEDTPFSIGVILSLYGGPRIGEACGLRWEDFDFENETMKICRTVSRIQDIEGTSGAKTKLVITTPKTECSIRTVPLPSKVFVWLKERRLDDPLYVLTGKETFMEPRACRMRFKRLLKRADIPDHTYHCLRHTYATRCVENGIDFKSLSEMLGHSDVKITMQRYVHPSMDFKKEQINKLPGFN
ncbi:MAG: site-specific integrase [Clostridiales bacterium]|nr:site-specific integrase [Clostridiales bacterium]